MTARWAFLEGFQVVKNDRPFLDRLRVLQTPLCGFYLHRIHVPDQDRDPHDHPWWFASLVLSGGYTERVWDNPADLSCSRLRTRRRFSLRSLSRSQAHTITHVDRVLWTLVVTGRRQSSWRFWTADGPVDWKSYTAAGEDTDA